MTVGGSWEEEYKKPKEYYILNGQRRKSKVA